MARMTRPAVGGRNATRDFHDEQRTNDTHASTADPEAKLYRKSKLSTSVGRKNHRPRSQRVCSIRRMTREVPYV